MTNEPRSGPLWAVTLLMAGLIIAGTLVSYDHGTAILFGLLGGVALPLVSLLHSLDGRGG